MTRVSVIVETVTVRVDHDHGPVADAVAPTLAALERQTLPCEIVLVLDDAVDAPTVAELERRYPRARLVHGVAPNYFAEKNAGVLAATSEIVAYIDGDCVPDATWLASLLAPLGADADVVSGQTRYRGRTLAARTFSVSDFGTVLDDGGEATGIMLNNYALRRELALRYPLDARIRRNGGCYLLYHQLRAAGLRLRYEPSAIVTHEDDVEGLGFVRKHFDRGFDGVQVYRCDDTFSLRGTRLFRRFGPIALAALTARRVLTDWRRVARTRSQTGISRMAVPYYAAVMMMTRTIELCGGIAAIVRRKR